MRMEEPTWICNRTGMGQLEWLIAGMVRKNVLMIRAACKETALLPVTGVCSGEAECLLCFRKIQASSGEP